MKLKYKIDRTNHLITLEIQDGFDEKKILQYIARELSIKNGLNSTNQGSFFLENYKEFFDNKKNTLNINYLNGNQGLLDISDVLSECFGIYMTGWLITDAVIEGMEDFNIPDEERFNAITNPNVLSNTFQIKSENTSNQAASFESTNTGSRTSTTYSFDNQKAGENRLNFNQTTEESDSNKLPERDLIIEVVNQLNESAVREIFATLKEVPAFKRCMESARKVGDESKRQKGILS